MPVEMAGFAQALARCLDFETVEPLELEEVLTASNEPLEMMYVEPSMRPPLVRSGMQFNYLLFVQYGTLVPWTYPHSELDAPFLVGVHEFLAEAERWVGSYSAVTESIVVTIPIGVMKLIAQRIPRVRDRMHQLIMLRLARFYWISLATSGTPSSRVAAALVSRLALQEQDYGENRTIFITQKDLGRLTTLSRSAVADGLASLMNSDAIQLGNKRPTRFSGVVLVPCVDLLKDHAFEEIQKRAIQPLLSRIGER